MTSFDPNIALNCITQTTRDMFDGRKPPRVNMTNGKPFRTKEQKAEAKRTAYRCKDGTWRSDAQVSFHRAIPVGQ